MVLRRSPSLLFFGRSPDCLDGARQDKILPKTLMANTILIGAQWGDEGKGKIIDVLTDRRRHRGAQPGRKQCRPYRYSWREEIHFCT